jgi:membrane protease YdiL (CAAX protease family)
VMAGIFLFAIFIHQSGPLRYIALGGVAGAAIMIGYSTRRTSILQAMGILKPDRGVLLYAVPAIVLGLLLAMLTRHKYGLSLLPAALGSLALLSPCIGAMEEVVFRGYMQGHLLPSGRIFSLLYASLAHTGYKLLVIRPLAESRGFDLPFLVIWTFIGGTAFGVLRDRSGSSIPPVIAHAIFDIVLYGGMSATPAWVWS